MTSRILFALLLSTAPFHAVEPPVECEGSDFGISCGYGFTQVEGVAVFQALNGEIRPVRRLKVFEGSRKVKVKTRRDGSFKFEGYYNYSHHKLCVDGFVDSKEIYGSQSFVLSARGCEDAEIVVSNDWIPRQILMKCNLQRPSN